MNKIFNFFKITGLVKFLSLISLKGKKNLKILFFFMLVASLLEILSIGILIPLINFIFDPSSISNIFNVQGFGIINFLANFDYVNLILFFIFIIYLIKSIFMIFYQYFNAKVLLNMSVDIKTRLFENYLNKNYLFHLNNNSSLLIRNVQNEIDVLMANYVSPILVFSLTVLNIVFICSFLLYYSFVSSLLVVIIFGITGLTLNFSVRKILRVIGERRKFFAYSILKNLRQSFTLIKEIKINSKENYFSNKLTSDNSMMAKLGIKRTVIGSLPRIIFEFLFITIVLSSIYYMNSSNINFENFLSLLTVYAIAAFRIMPSLNSLSTSYQKIKFGSPVLSTIYEALKDRNTQDVYFTNNKNQNFKFKSQLLLKEISFTYPFEKKPVFQDINLKIKKGEIIGIIGDNASGKSTLIDLICGLLKPSAGKIIIDNEELINVSAYQKIIGYVPQQIYLIDGNIKSNIAFGINEEDINLDKIKKVMSITGLDSSLNENDFIRENGKNISGGQKQKIAIARALYDDPEILILDEATSAMDTNAEKDFTEIVFHQKIDKTIIIISHRLQALDKCSAIYKINNKGISKIA